MSLRCPSGRFRVPQNFKVSLSVPQQSEVSLTPKDILDVSVFLTCPLVSLKISKCPSIFLKSTKCPSRRGTHWMAWCPLRVPRYPSKIPSVHPRDTLDGSVSPAFLWRVSSPSVPSKLPSVHRPEQHSGLCSRARARFALGM